MQPPPDRSDDSFELRLFLEEIACNVCRFQHVKRDRLSPATIRIDQEVFLGIPDAFADIRVEASGVPPYFVEVKYGYPAERIAQSLARKYGAESTAGDGAAKVILVVDPRHYGDWADLEGRLRCSLGRGLHLEVWAPDHLATLLRDLFGVSLPSMSAEDLLDVREAIDRAKGAYAFTDEQRDDRLEAALLWHFAFWRLRELRERGLQKRSILPPGVYTDVVVLMADLCSFSSYVRDTLDERVVQNCLTSFYAKSRYQIINEGGMLYQFLGDAVIALFGLPDKPSGYVETALDCASSLVEIGNAVSAEWQRQIDRVQASGGVHIGMAIGDLQIMSLRPFSRAHMGAIGDCINMTARLDAAGGSGEVVVSNTLFQQLPLARQRAFEELEPLEARNVGRIRAWKLTPERRARSARAGTALD